MAERRLRLDLTAWGFLLAGLLLALCVLSHDSADASGATVYPENAASHNLLGPPGAWIGDILYQTLGISLYVLLISWFVLVLMLSFSGCRKTPKPTPEPKPQEKPEIQSLVSPTAEQAYRMSSAAASERRRRRYRHTG